MPGASSKKIFGVPVRKIKVWIAGIVALIAAGVFLLSGDGIWSSMVIRNRSDNLQTRVDSLAQKNREMRERINALQAGEKNAIEEEARAHGMVKKGEKIYLFQEEEKK